MAEKKIRSVGNPRRTGEIPLPGQKNWVCYKKDDVICEFVCIARQERKDWTYCTRKCPCWIVD